MALINCPECNNKISTFAEVCPNCGYPIKIELHNKEAKYNLIYQYADERVVGVFQEILKISAEEEFDIAFNHPCFIKKDICYSDANSLKSSLESRGMHIAIVRSDECADEAAILKKYDTEPVRCPKCKSTDFSTGARGFSMLTGFVGAGKTVNRCAKCGYTWKP